MVKYISGFNDQPLTNRIVPIIAAMPTPAPTIKTKGNVQLFKISERYGALLTSTEEPKACKAPIAGSANVTPTPSIPIMIKTTIILAFLGKLSPIIVPKGISPVFKPSINTARPIMTATKPPSSAKKS